MTPEQLKASILQYAIQGKLVEQRPEEKKVDLSHIKLKKTEEFEFDIPDSWLTAHLESITKNVPSKQYQIAASDFKTTGKYPVVSQSKEYIIGYNDDASKLYRHENPVVIFGDHTTEVKYVDFDFIVGADGVKIFEPIETVIVGKFLKHILEFYSIGLEKVGGYSRHYKFIKDKAFPIPPLSEQKRIVAKIEELLPYVDRYAAAYEKLEQFNAKFPEDMKKSILQYAIQGKLVEQRPEEGTGEELYRQIRPDCQQEETHPKRRSKKATPVIIAEQDPPFDIPETWKWVKLGELGYTNIGLTYSPKDVCEDGIVVLRSSNIQNGKMDYEDIVKVSCPIPDNKMCHIGDILICARNGSKRLVGKAALIDQEGMSFGAFMAIFRSVCNPYILHVINSAYFRNTLLGDTGTTTINQITQDMLKNVLIPLPPLAEQKRIVAKLEEILPLCERLK